MIFSLRAIWVCSIYFAMQVDVVSHELSVGQVPEPGKYADRSSFLVYAMLFNDCRSRVSKRSLRFVKVVMEGVWAYAVWMIEWLCISMT